MDEGNKEEIVEKVGKNVLNDMWVGNLENLHKVYNKERDMPTEMFLSQVMKTVEGYLETR